jgi:O-antigen/teichoic acid export membrane protein
VGIEFVEIPNRWLYSLPVIAAMNMVNEFNLTILRNEKEVLQFGAYEVSKTILDLSVTLILVVVYLLGWEGRAGGILISTFLITIISLFNLWNKRYISVEIDRKMLKKIIYISLPLMLHSLGISIITLSDRLFIDRMVSTSAVGIYTVGYQFGMIILLVVTAFNRTWSPWMYELLAEDTEENKKTIVKATYLVGGGFVILALAITGIAYFLLPFMTAENYHGGTVYVIWIAMGYAFNGMYTLVFPYGVHVGKTSYLGITTFSAAIVNLIANYYLISINGALGAAQATLISYIIMFGSVWWYSNKLYPMPWFNSFKRNRR